MFLFALVTTLFITSCGQKQKGSNTLIRPVKTAQVSSQSVIRKDFSGIVEAVEYVRLAFRVSGQIISLPVVEGQRVKKGQLIAAIDPRDISLQYAADKAAYETAAAQVERNKRLLGRQLHRLLRNQGDRCRCRQQPVLPEQRCDRCAAGQDGSGCSGL